MTVSKKIGFSTTTDEVLHNIDLTGKVIIITGGASGLGIETVRALASAGADITIAARRIQPAEEVAKALRFQTGNQKIQVRQLDLSDLESVKQFVRDWNIPIDILINNAGIMALPKLERTAEGREMQFGTNFIGHFALTVGLHRWLKMAGKARVISIASSGNLYGPILWDDLDFRFIPYDPILAYAQSKTACTLLSVAIAQKWKGDGISSYSLNPGAIATNLQRHTGGLRTPKPLQKTLAQGAATTVYLVAAPLEEDLNGSYFEDCNKVDAIETRVDGVSAGVAPYALDLSNANRLWNIALTMIKEEKRND